MSGKSFALLCVTLVLLVGLSTQVPLHEQTKNLESTTVKILIPPSTSDKDSDSDAVVVEASHDDGESGTGVDEAKEFDPNDCFLEKSKGPCRAVIDAWYFNAATKNCEYFAWSGCGGNNNRFTEKIHCEKHCTNNATSTDAETAASEPIAASSTATTAAPNGNGTSSQCPVFDGCGPLKCAVVEEPVTGCKKCACSLNQDDGDNKKKANVPESVQVSTGGLVVGQPKLPVGSVSGTPSKLGEEDSSEINTETPEEVCQLPATRGHCRAMMTRWRYDPKIKECVEFHFGGCDGNSNNFVSKEKCVKYCKGQ